MKNIKTTNFQATRKTKNEELKNIIMSNKAKENLESNIGELRGILYSAKEAGLNVAILKIPARLFAIDERYQTPIRTERDLGYLLNNFNEKKLLPVVGVPHFEEGLVYLVDGQARWKVTQIIDKEKYEYLQCMVILDAPSDPKERLKYEAELYATQNANVKPVTPLQKHGAYLCMEHPVALAMEEVKDKYKFEFAYAQGQREAGTIGSYQEVFDVCRVHGKECLEYFFDIAFMAGFHEKANGYSKLFMLAIRDIWKYYPENREEIKAFLGKHLRNYKPLHLKSHAVHEYGMLTVQSAITLYIEDLCVNNINGIKHVRHVHGEKLVEGAA